MKYNALNKVTIAKVEKLSKEGFEVDAKATFINVTKDEITFKVYKQSASKRRVGSQSAGYKVETKDASVFFETQKDVVEFIRSHVELNKMGA